MLGLATWGVFGGLWSHGWVAWDDNGYIYENAMVRQGMTWKGLKWAWTTKAMGNWHPLTWTSLMLDRELFGEWPGGGHLETVVLHWVNALLLWWVLGRLTGCRGVAWWVALLWAVHPLRVESVAWASERKDVLSVLFGLAAAGMYAGGRRASNRQGDEPLSGKGRTGTGKWRMWGVAGWLAASLMCKPTMVTLPCVLLLLDGWPLGRWRRGAMWRLAGEKWLLWVLAAAACAATLSAQRGAMAVAGLESVGLGERVSTALTGYGWYLKKWAWPAWLAFFYPREWAGVTAWGAVAWGVVLAAISAGAVWAWKKRGWGWAGVGWLWFLGTLVPMIGLVQVGGQVWADRYSYWPEMGLWMAVAGTVGAVVKTPAARRSMAVAAMVWAAGLGWVARQQVATWKNDESLHARAVAVTGKNAMAERMWGEACYRAGRRSEALEAWERAVRAAPGQWEAMNNLAWVLLEEGRVAEARMWIDRAMEHGAARASAGARDTEAAVGRAESERTRYTMQNAQ